LPPSRRLRPLIRWEIKDNATGIEPPLTAVLEPGAYRAIPCEASRFLLLSAAGICGIIAAIPFLHARTCKVPLTHG
jgi:hypothetical protein